MISKHYIMKYLCLNCKTWMFLKIDFGKEVPSLNSADSPIIVCNYCGCRNWSGAVKPDKKEVE